MKGWMHCKATMDTAGDLCKLGLGMWHVTFLTGNEPELVLDLEQYQTDIVPLLLLPVEVFRASHQDAFWVPSVEAFWPVQLVGDRSLDLEHAQDIISLSGVGASWKLERVALGEGCFSR